MTDIPKGAVELAEKWIFDVVRHDTGQWISPEARNEIASLIAEAVKPLEEAATAGLREIESVLNNNMEHDLDGSRPRLPIEMQLRAAMKKWREG